MPYASWNDGWAPKRNSQGPQQACDKRVSPWFFVANRSENV